MSIQTYGIKNCVSVIQTRIKSNIKIEDTEFIPFLDAISKFADDIEEMDKRLYMLERELMEYRASPAVKSTQSLEDGYLNNILNRISILKTLINNNIQKEGFIADDVSFSPHLILVEEIEKSVRLSKKVTNRQFEQLNEMYLAQQKIAGNTF